MKGQSNCDTSQTNYLKEIKFDELRDFLKSNLEQKVRLFAMEYITDIFNQEVTELCGRPGQHKNKGNLAYRGGSENGWITYDKQRTQIRKPRVRKGSHEVQLQTYQALQSMDNLGEIIRKYMVHGISTRSYDQILEKFADDLGLSKSSVSRQFTKKSRESLNHLNTRSFNDNTFWCLMVDGIEFGGSILVVAVGVDLEGEKHILGLSEGASENAEVCKSVLGKLFEEHRKIKFTKRIVAVIDGSPALRKGIKQIFGNQVEFQRCTEHKKRNVLSKLNKKYHNEFQSKYSQAVHSTSYNDAKFELDNLFKWLSERNYDAAKSLEEAGDDLLTLHRINLPVELRNSFSSTNIIESAFSHPRCVMNRVKKWQKETDMLQRWAAVTFLDQEKRFRRINNFKYIEIFLVDFLSEKNQSNFSDKISA